MSRLHNYKPLILLFFFSFCFFAGGQIARIFPPASVRTDDKSPSGNAASSGTVPTASTSGNPLSTILPAAENWGLSFQEEGKVPVGNASFDELQQYHAYYAQKTDKKVIYLTFDCGYENGNTPAILNALKRHNVQATFFVVGNFLRDNPELIKQMLKGGHTIGNHTFHHPDMSQIATKETFSRELKSVETLYKDITGKSMTRFYRPPQGKYSTENLQMAKDMGYHTFFWSLAYVDWLADAQPSKEEAFDKLLGRIHPGASCCCITPPVPMARFWMSCLQNGRRWGIHFLHSKSLSGTLENKNKPFASINFFLISANRFILFILF